METQKMSFKNIKDVLSRDEMKKILAGSGYGCENGRSYSGLETPFPSGSTITYYTTYCCTGAINNTTCSIVFRYPVYI
jgi:hypothetical protein